MKLYVGNLSYEMSDEELRQAFEPFGKVNSAEVVRDSYTRQSKGFGFVEMGSAEEGQKAIAELNGKDVKGRKLNVNEARPREPRTFRGGQGGGQGGGGNWRGGNRGGERQGGGRSW